MFPPDAEMGRDTSYRIDASDVLTVVSSLHEIGCVFNLSRKEDATLTLLIHRGDTPKLRKAYVDSFHSHDFPQRWRTAPETVVTVRCRAMVSPRHMVTILSLDSGDNIPFYLLKTPDRTCPIIGTTSLRDFSTLEREGDRTAFTEALSLCGFAVDQRSAGAPVRLVCGSDNNWFQHDALMRA